MKTTIAILLTILAISGAVIILNDLPEKPIACTSEAKICPDGSAVGRTGPDCEFENCPGEEDKTYCTQEQRNTDGCIEIYQPVCGWADETIQCLKWPCASTYQNYCFACIDENVEYYILGKCPG